MTLARVCASVPELERSVCSSQEGDMDEMEFEEEMADDEEDNRHEEMAEDEEEKRTQVSSITYMTDYFVSQKLTVCDRTVSSESGSPLTRLAVSQSMIAMMIWTYRACLT